MKSIYRKDAIQIIVSRKMELMSELQKRDAIANEGLEINLNNRVVYGSDLIDLDEFIKISLVYNFYGVKNRYIEKLFKDLIGGDIYIIGVPEKMYPCKCCNFFSLKEERDYEICKVCFWEDDGGSLSGYSSANKMSLAEAQENYRKIGCIDVKYLGFVEKYPYEKFESLTE